MKNSTSIEFARSIGIIADRNLVSYNVHAKRDNRYVGGVSFPIVNDSVAETLANRCCFFGKTPFISTEGIAIEIEAGEFVAKLVIPSDFQVVKSSFDGALLIIPR